MAFEPDDADLRSWWESLTEGQKDLLREHCYEAVLPEEVTAILHTCPGWAIDSDAGWWPRPLRWLLHEHDPDLG